MLFNSFAFILFLPTVFILYWFVVNKSLKAQNLFLILSSYFFYGWWDWRFLILIFLSSLSDYILSIQIDRSASEKGRKQLLYLSIFINLATLFFFKYFNFFIDNFTSLINSAGFEMNTTTLNIILPVGISFYTFQSMSYTLDVYHKDIKPTKDISIFLAYISFFPQLVAGPIERASQLIPQFQKKRHFTYDQGVDGLRQILWGVFKKVVIADNCATYVNQIFENYSDYSGSTLALGMLLFAFQIYGDFSGYSDIAIGTARLFGFNLMENFRFPFFATNIADFWRRWHISLSSWLRDYLYTPLAIKTRNWGINGIYFSTMASFVIIGFWHGANWTFIMFGFLYGLGINIELLTKKRKKRLKKKINTKLYNTIGMISTFAFYAFTLVLFRSNSITDAFYYYKQMFSTSLFSMPTILSPKYRLIYVILIIIVFIIVEWKSKEKRHVLEINRLTSPKRWLIYSAIISSIIIFARFNQSDFIYFQF